MWTGRGSVTCLPEQGLGGRPWAFPLPGRGGSWCGEAAGRPCSRAQPGSFCQGIISAPLCIPYTFIFLSPSLPPAPMHVRVCTRVRTCAHTHTHGCSILLGLKILALCVTSGLGGPRPLPSAGSGPWDPHSKRGLIPTSVISNTTHGAATLTCCRGGRHNGHPGAGVRTKASGALRLGWGWAIGKEQGRAWGRPLGSELHS